jgi:signal transduction histidine kinase
LRRLRGPRRLDALLPYGNPALYISVRVLPSVSSTSEDDDARRDFRQGRGDAGCGIPANVFPRLGTVGVTTRDEGTGLGLSLALQVITRHEGVMRIESIERRGTTVTIWLPGNSTSKP